RVAVELAVEPAGDVGEIDAGLEAGGGAAGAEADQAAGGVARLGRGVHVGDEHQVVQGGDAAVAGGRQGAPAGEGAVGPVAGGVGGQVRVVEAVEDLDVALGVHDEIPGALGQAAGRDDGVADLLPGGGVLHQVRRAAAAGLGADEDVPGGGEAVFQL